MRLTKLLNEVLNEIGDLNSIEPMYVKYHSPEAAYSYTDSMDRIDMKIKSDEKWSDLEQNIVEIPKIVQQTYNQTKGNKDIISVGFSVNNDNKQGNKLDLKEYYRILKTVLDFTNNYINKFQPFIILIIAEEISLGKNTKNNLYLNIIKHNINNNYKIIDNIQTKDGHKGTIIMRLK